MDNHPNPANPATARKILAKSWCVSKSKWLRFSHLWAIENFDFYMNSYEDDWLVQSTPFGCDDNSVLMDEEQSIRWWLKLSQLPDKRELLFLKFNPTISPVNKNMFFKARFKAAILNSVNEQIYFRDENVKNIIANEEYSLELINCNALMKLKSDYMLSELKLLIEIQVLSDLAHISGPCHGSKRKYQHESIADDYGRLLESSSFSDVTLVVHQMGSAPKEIKAHQAILSARSSVFAAMFSHPMKEKSSGLVHITDLEGHVLEKLLYYIYTGKIDKLKEHAKELLIASDKYGIEQLKLICEERLCFTLDVSNAWALFFLADMYNAKHLKVNAEHFIRQNNIQQPDNSSTANM